MCYFLDTKDKALQSDIVDSVMAFMAANGMSHTEMMRLMGIAQPSSFSEKINKTKKRNFTARDLNNLKTNCPQALDAILKKTQGRVKKAETKTTGSAVAIGENNSAKVVKITKAANAQASISAADFLTANESLMNAESQKVLALFIKEDAADKGEPLCLPVSAWTHIVRVCLKLQKGPTGGA